MKHKGIIWLQRGLLGCSLSLITTATALPNTSLAYLRSEYRWLGQPLNWIEGLSLGPDLTHVILFALLGITAYSLMNRVPFKILLGLLVATAAASEIVQFWIPGRNPRLSDFGDDLLGLVIGLAIAWSLHRLLGVLAVLAAKPVKDDQPS